LLVGILVPVLAFVVINSISVYRQALAAADTAYDRTLLASAKAIGELLEVQQDGPTVRLRASLVYSALEAFEADNRSRIYYKVTGFQGETVSGFNDLPKPQFHHADSNVYAALVQFYDDRYDTEPVRMAVLQQPVAGAAGQGMATVQVAETLEVRRNLARSLLVQTLWQQALLVAVIAAVVVAVVQRATQPVRSLSAALATRAENDLSPLASENAPRELQPVVEAMNGFMGRVASLLEHQKRFIRDTSHQLRTPLAVLKAQVQSARRGDMPAQQALAEISATVDGAAELANQMLALAKVEQLRQEAEGHSSAPTLDWADITRSVALDVAPLIAEGQIDFEIHTTPTAVQAHAWALRELTRNLLHNAIRHTPPHGALQVQVHPGEGQAVLSIADSGPGISHEQRTRLFQPFSASAVHGGSGLGLAICHGIVQALGGDIELTNQNPGLLARVKLKLAE
jgi:two-component system, OmpR family, sensor histidine kinase TctE